MKLENESLKRLVLTGVFGAFVFLGASAINTNAQSGRIPAPVFLSGQPRVWQFARSHGAGCPGQVRPRLSQPRL